MIEQTYIDGIPTLVAPADGPLRGGITFRVGNADESLASSGVTHLVEHLALHRLGLTDYHYNGATGATVTHFISAGSTDDVGKFINGVCEALTDLPFERLDVEKDILRTESASRQRSAIEPMWLWRYGPRSYGIAAYPEWGLGALTADSIRAWVTRYFTRENAVLWFTGAPPANLRVSLPSGQRRPLPTATSALPRTPASMPGPPRVIAVHTHVTRSLAGAVYAGVLERELFRALRQEGGYSYAATANYEPIDPHVATVTALVDAHPDKQDAALGGFVDVLAKLRAGRIERSDMDALLAQTNQAMSEPDADAGRLPTMAFNLLTGAPVETAQEALRRLGEVSVADVHAVAQEAAANALLMVPQGMHADWAGFEAAPATSHSVVSGTRYPMRTRPDLAVVLGDDGVSVTSADGSVATVRYDACAAMLLWADGGRLLIGDDGISCALEPTLYPVDAAALRRLDAAVAPELVVRLPAREPDALPAPPPPGPALVRQLKRERAERRAPWLLAALVVLSAVMLVVGAQEGTAAQAAGRPQATWSLLLALGGVIVMFAWFYPIILMIRRSNRRRIGAR